MTTDELRVECDRLTRENKRLRQTLESTVDMLRSVANWAAVDVVAPSTASAPGEDT